VLIHKPKLVWVYGPTKPGKHTNLSVFQLALKPILQTCLQGWKVFADAIYASEPDYMVTKNDLDPPEIKVFKNRIGSHHKNFNGLLKNFACLSEVFDNGVEWHGTCFHAVAAITQYQIDCGGYSLLDPYP
jgi:hypothetical protein